MADPDQRSIFTDPNLRRIVAMVRAHPRPLAVALIALAISELTDPAMQTDADPADRGFYDRQDNAVPVGAAGLCGCVPGPRGWPLCQQLQDQQRVPVVLVELRRRMSSAAALAAGHAQNTPPGS